MKNFKPIIVAAVIAAFFTSCEKKAVIEGKISGRPEAELIVTVQGVRTDTLKTDAEGCFHYEIKPIDSPRFVYLNMRSRRIGSLIALPGDQISFTGGDRGDCVIEGSPESEKLSEAEKDFQAYYTATLIADTREELARAYLDYYRKSVSFVISNPGSLASAAVLMKELPDGLPLFRQSTDALIFRNATDSLKVVWPGAPVVKALEKETARREGEMEILARLEKAEEVPFPEIDLPGMDGKNHKLSEVRSKMTMLYFWASSAEQNMFNIDALVPVYEKFAPLGLEIYAVSLDVDKTRWAGVVRGQKLPWINVCDTRGAASPFIGLYGLSSLPTIWFITEGAIDTSASVSDAESISRYLDSKL